MQSVCTSVLFGVWCSYSLLHNESQDQFRMSRILGPEEVGRGEEAIICLRLLWLGSAVAGCR